MTGALGPSNYSFNSIPEGLEIQRIYHLSPEVHATFIEAFGDRSPIHVDAEYARAAGFPGLVMHGTILNGFLSHFVGMVFPGRSAFLLAVDLRYHQPAFMGDDVELTVKVKQRLESRNVLLLQVSFARCQDKTVLADGKVTVMVRDA